jgi:hypothetical protein
MGRIPANRLVEQVHTRRPYQPAAAGVLGLGWASNWAARSAVGLPGGMAGWAKPVGWLSFGPLGEGI